MTQPIKVTGLAKFVRDLGKLDRDLPKQVRVALNGIADIVIAEAKPDVPTRTGKAKASIRPRSTRTAVRVIAGGPKVPYYPWLDFGGRVGRNKSVRRPVKKDGRYLYPAYYRKKPTIHRELETALVEIAERAFDG